MTPVEQIQEQAHKLQELILANHPTMPVLLKQIWVQLKNDPETVTILPEETVHMIVRGLVKQTNVDIATTISKSKSPANSIKSVVQDWKNKL